MTTVSTRWVCLFLVCLVLSGCNVRLPMLDQPATKETKLFAKGLDQYLENGDLTTMRLIPAMYPEGEWRPRAEALIAQAEQRQQEQEQQQEREQQQMARLKKKDQELLQYQQEKEALVEDNQMLEVTLERLKQVLIDMELREK